MVILSDRDPAAEKAENRIPLGVDLRTFLTKEPDPAVHQQRPECVNDPVKAADEADTQQNKDRAHDQSADNSPEEHFVLVFAGNAEIAKNQEKHEKIVYAQRKLDGIAGNELQRGNAAMPEIDDRRERSRQNDPHGAPGKSLPESDFVCATMKYPEV